MAKRNRPVSSRPGSITSKLVKLWTESTAPSAEAPPPLPEKEEMPLPRDSSLNRVLSSSTDKSYRSFIEQESDMQPSPPPKSPPPIARPSQLPPVHVKPSPPVAQQQSPSKLTGPREEKHKKAQRYMTMTTTQMAQMSRGIPREGSPQLRVQVTDINEIPQIEIPGYITADGKPPQVPARKTSKNDVLSPTVQLFRKFSNRFKSPQLQTVAEDLEGQSVSRRSSLTRPERARNRNRWSQNIDNTSVRSISSAGTKHQSVLPNHHFNHNSHLPSDAKPWEKERPLVSKVWASFARGITCYIPSHVLESWFGKKTEEQRQAWREKVALCEIIVVLWTLLGFITFGFQYFTCGLTQNKFGITLSSFDSRYVSVRGQMFDISRFDHPDSANFNKDDIQGKDVSWLFPVDRGACNGLPGVGNFSIPCTVDAGGNAAAFCHDPAVTSGSLLSLTMVGPLIYDWNTVTQGNKFIVYNGLVLNLDRYFTYGNGALGSIDTLLVKYLGKDITRSVIKNSDYKQRMDCLVERFQAGVIDSTPIGCFASLAFTYVSLACILAVILAQFFLAMFFLHTTGDKLGKYPPGHDPALQKQKTMADSRTESRSESQMSGDSAVTLSPAVKAVIENNKSRSSLSLPKESRFSQQYNIQSSRKPGSYVPSPLSHKRKPSQVAATPVEIPGILRTIMMVTCYSEGEESLRASMDSLAKTTFPDSHKMLLIVSDGLITGDGNSKSTPEIIIDMLEMDEQFQYPPMPYSYVAIADGSKRHNMAQVYAGRYVVDGHHIPAVLVVKCGTPEESQERKPGNRGKRDSQVLIMNFLSKVLFDDRMTPLEYDLFTKMTAVTSSSTGVKLDSLQYKVTPDQYELVLMVDADTRVNDDSLVAMSYAMASDPKIIGLCGETQVENKWDSWVTMIQVFEYYLAHFQSKSFESVFGSSTCNPGCFSMYRVKAPKGSVNPKTKEYDFYVPVLANPDIIAAYSENVVDTLHAKNLLLLGEDRYLTTLMLKNFPKRKMVFVPRAICRTIVPDTFSVLLSQRRRWINSTIHNLLELVLLRDLCGIFCFSMQFVIFMGLVGTAVLPAAISFTIYLLVISFFVNPKPIIPLLLLAAILGLPAFLILFTGRRWSYLGWMLIYLISLPVWNFVMPAYSFWHFDDFSWGTTRKLQGSENALDDNDGLFDPSKIVMKRWSEWERERRQHSRRDYSRTRSMFN